MLKKIFLIHISLKRVCKDYIFYELDGYDIEHDSTKNM